MSAPSFADQLMWGRATIRGACTWCDGPWEPCAIRCVKRPAPAPAPKLRREVEPHRHLMRARHVVLALIGCIAVLLASQQCAGQVRTRLDAAIARDPLPERMRGIERDVADLERRVHAVELGTTIAELRQSVAALQSQVDAVAPVVDAAVSWRATPAVDPPNAVGGSTALWVRAHRRLEKAIDAYRAAKDPL